MPRLGQQFLVFVFPHLFSALFDDTTQKITSSPARLNSIALFYLLT
jgi:hypothetical protein